MYIDTGKFMIQANGLSIQFREERVLENFSFRIPAGCKCCITGPSGSGKSSLLNSILGFVKPAAGHISVSGFTANEENIRTIRSMTAYLPQELNLQLENVRELAYFPFNFKNNRKNKPAEKELLEMLKRFGLDESILGKSLSEISGGQKQRIALASCILQKKTILILDEPTSALDQTSIRMIIDFLFNDKDLTVVSASHNEEWTRCCDLVIPVGIKNQE